MTIIIRVQPRAKRNSVEFSEDGAIRVRVTAPPDKGKANRAAIKLLADRLGAPISSLRIVRGHRSRNKVIQVDGLDNASVVSLIRELA